MCIRDRAMTEAKLARLDIAEPIYDPQAITAQPITGRVIKTGILDDVNDRSYMVLDTLEGQALFVETGAQVNIEGIKAEMIVQAGPQSYSPKQSDFPQDYLKRAVSYERKRGFNNPVKLNIVSRVPLKDLTNAIGKTWLDEELKSGSVSEHLSGFGDEVYITKVKRRRFLVSQNLIGNKQQVTSQTLKSLEQLDLKNAAKSLICKYDKPYKPATANGKLSGIYREAIQRPSGKYAVIEQSREFTLVPWRETLQRNLGKSVTAVIKGQSISWVLTKGRSIL